MLFASPLFLFLFLPLTLLAYGLARQNVRHAVLLVASLLFYVWGEGRYAFLVVALIAVNWRLGLVITRHEGRQRSRWLAAAVALNLGVLMVFKYANFFVANLNLVFHELGLPAIVMAPIPLPLGISFFTFHAISYLVDVHKRNATAEARLSRFALYILLFPQLIAGPIIRWRDIYRQFDERHPGWAEVAYGARRFVLGLAKKVLIANTLGAEADRVFALPADELTTPLAWLGIVCYTLQIYFDFSGYSDMALGLMRMFGFRILENFNHPYIAQSVREFWRRWHISLSNWFRDYLYIPLGGSRQGPLRSYVNLAVVFLLCGLWHGASWPFVVWGLWHGVFLVLERAGLDRLLSRIGRLRHVYTLLAVMGGWVLFRCETMAQAGSYFTALAGLGAADAGQPMGQRHVDPLLMFTLALAVVGATPWSRTLGRWRDRVITSGGPAAGWVATLDGAWLLGCFVLSCAWLAAGTHNPFIYFRF